MQSAIGCMMVLMVIMKVFMIAVGFFVKPIALVSAVVVMNVFFI